MLIYVFLILLVLIIALIWSRNRSNSNNSRWTNAHVRKLIPGLTKEFGQPAYDINTPNGLIAWQNVGIFSSIFLEDVSVAHDLGSPHCDPLIGVFYIFIKEEYIPAIFSINIAIGYHPIRFVLQITCKSPRWITCISYVALRVLDGLDFPEFNSSFDVQDAKTLLPLLVNQIDNDQELYISLQTRISEYLERNRNKYHDILYNQLCSKQN